MIDLTLLRSIHWMQSWIHTLTTPRKIRWIMGGLVALLSIINGLSVLFPVHPGRKVLLYLLLDEFTPFVPSGGMFLYTGRTMTLLLGFFLLLVATGLIRGKRRAWQFAVVLLPATSFAYLVKGLEFEAALLVTIVWALLLSYRACFRVESDPWHMRQGAMFLVLGVVLLLLYVLGGYYILQNQFFTVTVARSVFHALFRRVIALPTHELIPETRLARWFLDSIPWLSSAVLLTGMVLILRPVSERWWLGLQEEKKEQTRTRAWELIKRFGAQTMAFFALAPETLRYIALGGEGVINYRLVGDTAVVLGDPVAAPAARERVMRQFLNLCALKDWRVAIYQARVEAVPLYRKLGLHVIKIGEEALLCPQNFTLKGSAMANVRTSARRAEREGVTLNWYDGAPPIEVVAQLQQLSRAWLKSKGGKQGNEIGFSMGRLSELCAVGHRSEEVAKLACQDGEPLVTPRLLLLVAHNQAGEPCAFMSFTPIYGRVQTGEHNKKECADWGWALDLMRRMPDAPPGVMELLLVRAIERFREAGAQVVSLGMVGLADTRQEMSSGQQSIARLATEHVQLLETHQSLMHFKKKFQPAWESRYVVASNTLALPKIALALLRAHQS